MFFFRLVSFFFSAEAFRGGTLTSSALSAIWSKFDSEEARLILPGKTFGDEFSD